MRIFRNRFVKRPYYLERVEAVDAAAAHAAVGSPGDRLFVAEETARSVDRAVEAKLKRVFQNPNLYGDLARHLEGVLKRLQEGAASQDPVERARAVAQAMLEHGDVRCDAAGAAVVVRAVPGVWWVFGYAAGSERSEGASPDLPS